MRKWYEVYRLRGTVLEHGRCPDPEGSEGLARKAVAPEALGRLWSAVDRAGMCSWSGEFTGLSACGGKRWSLAARHAGKTLQLSGSDAFPPDGTPEMSPAFGHVIAALSSLRDSGSGEGSSKPALPRRFFAVIDVDPTRVTRDVGRISDEVLQHLVTVPDARVRVTLDIQAEIPSGVDDAVQRVLTENARVLGFKDYGFERE